MIIGALDIATTLLYLATAGVIVYSLLTVRGSSMVVPSALAVGAMLIEAVVSAGNALESLGVSSALHSQEEYLEILFVPLMVYVMYGLYAEGQTIRAERERNIVSRLGHRLTDSMEQLGEHRLGMLQALSAAVDARDHYTALHSMHVADYACAIGYRLGLRDQIVLFERAGLLHDIGKIGVPDSLLLKPGRLTDEEYEVIKRHVEESASIIETVPFLADVVPMVRHHHERWDGSGYPDGLAGDDIPAASRVLAVADAFDAMTTDRPYRPAMAIAEATSRLIEGRGAQFDPTAVDALVQLVDDGIVRVSSEATPA